MKLSTVLLLLVAPFVKGTQKEDLTTPVHPRTAIEAHEHEPF